MTTTDIQFKLVELIDSLFIEAKEFIKLQAETQAEFEKFVHALLAKAFRGEL